jgi:glycosyltransferase involved in cell wall biosynthesis
MISVCISTYNRSQLVVEMLESFLAQCQQVSIIDEFVIVLNACTDNTEEVLLNYVKKFDTFDIKLIILKNINGLHPSESYGRVISESKNQWVWPFSDDDIILPGCLENIKSIVENHKDIEFISTNFQRVEYDLATKIGGPNLPHLLGGYYTSMLEFVTSSELMHLSFISSLIFKKDLWLNSQTIQNRLYIDTNYQHVCVFVEKYMHQPLFAMSHPGVVNRANYRVDQFDRNTEKPFALTIKQGIEARIKLTKAFIALKLPDQVLKDYKSSTVLNSNFFFQYGLAKTIDRPDFDSFRSNLIELFGDVEGFMMRIKLVDLVPSFVFIYFGQNKNFLKKIHRFHTRFFFEFKRTK